jgi:predicted nucleic acid-binding protein
MPEYVLDTQLYVEATRSPARNRELVACFTRQTPSIYLHSVVAAELLAGAVGRGLETRTRRAFLAPVEAVGRVLASVRVCEPWPTA